MSSANDEHETEQKIEIIASSFENRLLNTTLDTIMNGFPIH